MKPIKSFMLGVFAMCAATAAMTANPDSIPDSSYVIIDKDGHLSLAGKRVRYWGIIGHWVRTWAWDHDVNVPSDPPDVRARKLEDYRRDLVAATNRMVDIGFNLIRLWDRPEPGKEYRIGDNSPNDMLAFFLNEMDRRGIKVWMSTLMGGEATEKDVTIVNDPATADAWLSAVKKRGGRLSVWSPARIWDRRLEAVSIRYKARMADWRNLYKGGLRLADDPQVVIWELLNEERWIQKMLRGEWQREPKFLVDELLQQWNAFLTAKYGSQDKLIEAWIGLLPGESLIDRTIQLTPMVNRTSIIMPSDANPQVLELLKKTAGQKYGRDHFNRQRGADVIEFFLDIQREHKLREIAALKKLGKSCRLSPCIEGTAEGYDIHDLYKFQFSSDAVAIATYMNGMHHDSTHQRFPWYSGLEELPRTGWNVPWMETQRIPGKPYVVYECGMENPAKYRAEWPYRITSLASIQDFDIINWHIFDNHTHTKAEGYKGTMMYTHSDPKVNASEGPIGLVYANDEVFTSALKACSRIFCNFELKAPENPTTFVFGKKSLYDPATMDYGVAYGQYGNMIMPTTYRYGSRMYIDTARNDDQVIGPVYQQRIFEPNPIKPTNQIEYNWQKGYLKFDAPQTAAWIGFFAEQRGPVVFNNGITLDNVTIVNDKGIAYPVAEDERYIAFSVSAQDGKPLSKSKTVLISLVSTSFNKGFKLDESKFKSEYLWQANPGAIVERGAGPALYARAGARITAPMLDGMRYVMKDWHMEVIGKGTVSGGKIIVPATKPIFTIELTR